jgi:hypothetical protein
MATIHHRWPLYLQKAAGTGPVDLDQRTPTAYGSSHSRSARSRSIRSVSLRWIGRCRAASVPTTRVGDLMAGQRGFTLVAASSGVAETLTLSPRLRSGLQYSVVADESSEQLCVILAVKELRLLGWVDDGTVALRKARSQFQGRRRPALRTGALNREPVTAAVRGAHGSRRCAAHALNAAGRAPMPPSAAGSAHPRRVNRSTAPSASLGRGRYRPRGNRSASSIAGAAILRAGARVASVFGRDRKTKLVPCSVRGIQPDVELARAHRHDIGQSRHNPVLSLPQTVCPVTIAAVVRALVGVLSRQILAELGDKIDPQPDEHQPPVDRLLAGDGGRDAEIRIRW